ncbi:MAG: serine/threonine protein kinase [Actinomycetales bacterium]|nr:serine/threonine protein kinase [Actinomycetales bacterium]
MKPGEGVALGGRYRLVERIAVGGMGEVWRAHDEALARDVAVKVLREEYAGDEGFLERFRTEARNCAQLSHPNIAQLFDYGEQDGSAFLVMELILGEPLSDLLDREPVLPTRRLLPILAETARALHAAHVAGVVHRDVKPGNIILSRAGRVKITDFGISTATGRIPMTDSGMVMGTAQYLSPEQAIGKAATPASDIYSLGIVAYEALAGKRPFTGPTAVDIAVAHVNTPVPPLPSDVDPELAALVMRMLSKDPEERPRSAASLARVLDDIAVRTPSTGIPPVLGRHARPVDVVDAVSGATATVPPPAPAPQTPAPQTPASAPQTPAPPAAPAEAAAPAPAPEATPPGRAAAREAALSPVARWARGARRGLATAARRVASPVPASVGRRWAVVSRPLVVLVLMVLFALLGAWFADSVWGRSRSAPPPDDAGRQILVLASPVRDLPRGIIDHSPDTTTTRDQ